MAKTVILIVTVCLVRLVQMKIGTTRIHIREQVFREVSFIFTPH